MKLCNHINLIMIYITTTIDNFISVEATLKGGMFNANVIHRDKVNF